MPYLEPVDYDPFAPLSTKEHVGPSPDYLEPVDYDPFKDEEPPSAIKRPTTLTGVGKAALRGAAESVTTEIPGMLGGATEFLAREAQKVPEIAVKAIGAIQPAMGGILETARRTPQLEAQGKRLKELAKQKAEEWYGPPPEDQSEIERIVYEGTKMLAPSLIPGSATTTGVRFLSGLGGIVKAAKAADAINDVAKATKLWGEAKNLASVANNFGSMAVAGLFGASQAQQTRDVAMQRADELEKSGLPEEAKAMRESAEGIAPWLTGGIEAAGEFLGTRYLGKLFKLDESEVVKRGAKNLIFDFLKTLGVETGTEFGQQFGEAGVEKITGIRPEANPLSEALDVVGPTAFMTLLTGGLAAGANRAIRKQPQESRDLLEADERDGGTAIAKKLKNDFMIGKLDAGTVATILGQFPKDHPVAKMGNQLLAEYVQAVDLNPIDVLEPLEGAGLLEAEREQDRRTALMRDEITQAIVPEGARKSAEESAAILAKGPTYLPRDQALLQRQADLNQERVQTQLGVMRAQRTLEEEHALASLPRAREELQVKMAEEEKRSKIEGMGGLAPYVHGLLQEVQEGKPGKRHRVQYPDGTEIWMGIPSSYPEFMRDKYGRDESIMSIEKGLSGHVFTEQETKQKAIWEDVLATSQEALRNDIVQFGKLVEEDPAAIQDISDFNYQQLLKELRDAGYTTRAIQQAAERYRGPIQARAIAETARRTGIPQEDLAKAFASQDLDLEEIWREATLSEEEMADIVKEGRKEHAEAIRGYEGQIFPREERQLGKEEPPREPVEGAKQEAVRPSPGEGGEDLQLVPPGRPSGEERVDEKSLTEALMKAVALGPAFAKMLTFDERAALSASGYTVAGQPYDMETLLKAAKSRGIEQEEVTEQKPKEPWEMTREEFLKPVKAAAYREKATGKILEGLPSEVHIEILERHKIPFKDVESKYEAGFIDQTGQFLTRDEASKLVKRPDRKTQLSVHKEYVAQAISAGKAVPPEVLKDYPDLQPTLATDIEKAAQEADTEPTPAQQEAGNYQKGHITLHGLNISIENPKGSTREGVDRQGKPWKTTMKAHYGYIRRTEDEDGDQVDVFIGPNPESEKVFVIDQIDPETREFDEHKVMLGYDTEKKAKVGYLANYQPGWKGLGGITTYENIEQFKEFLFHPEGLPKRPVSEYPGYIETRRDWTKLASQVHALARRPDRPEARETTLNEVRQKKWDWLQEYPKWVTGQDTEFGKKGNMLLKTQDGTVYESGQSIYALAADEFQLNIDNVRGLGMMTPEGPMWRTYGQERVKKQLEKPPEIKEQAKKQKAEEKPVEKSPTTIVEKPTEEKPTATFLGWQEAGTPGKPPFPMYNIVGGPYDKSTVGAGRLVELEIRIPETPAYKKEEKAPITPKEGAAILQGGRGGILPEQPRKEVRPSEPEGMRETEAETEITKEAGQPEAANVALISKLRPLINQGKTITWQGLFKFADEAYGGTQAEGRYTPKDAYDALEVAFNQVSLYDKARNYQGVNTSEHAVSVISGLTSKIERLPTQTKRTEEMEAFQQYSTPHPLAFMVNWVANIQTSDVVLEPSAGTGNIAIFAKIMGANKVLVNELSNRRANLLRLLPFDKTFELQGEQINNMLPENIKPTVVVMNPPFSATAGRMKGKKVLTEGAQHVEQALKRLEPSGRLVAIVGRGMDFNTPTFGTWWSRIGKEYDVKANVLVSGEAYRKFGTTFDNRILVIDKIPPSGYITVTGKVDSYEQLPTLLDEVRNARPERREVQPTVEGGAPAVRGEAGLPTPVLPATGGVLPGEGARGGPERGIELPTPQPERVATGERLEVPPGGGGGRPGQLPTGQPEPEPVRPGGAPVGPPRQPVGGGVGGIPQHELTTRELEIEAKRKDTQSEVSGSIYETYSPEKLKIPGAKQHPTALVQSAAMADVEPITPTYRPSLPQSSIDEGRLSDIQLEAIVYAGQAHETIMPDGRRKGFFIGDGTGVGKGREIAGILWDNWNKGRKKAIWLSEKKNLFQSAARDMKGAGWDSGLLIEHNKIPTGTRDKSGHYTPQQIKHKQGILFTTYDTLKMGPKESGQPSRMDQVAEWVGKDFDGVIIFDEAHNMGNAVPFKSGRGMTKAAAKALAGIELQTRLPKARIVYASATGATDVVNLAYGERLGLWGEGTAFADKLSFVEEIASGGVAAMELVARDMKALGIYMARNLDYQDVTYRKMDVPLTKDQKDIYDELVGGWQLVLKNINKALELTGAVELDEQGQPHTVDPRAKSAAMSAFWGAHQRFFNQVLTAMQTPATIKTIKKDLADGNAVVVQLTSTMAAQQDRALAKLSEEETLEDLDMTPRDGLMQMIEHSFPVHQIETYIDENGNERSRILLDSNKQPVVNPEAVKLRDALLDKLGSIRVPDSPIDMIINEIGPDNVAEITGRQQRVVNKRDEKGQMRKQIERRSQSSLAAEIKDFNGDKKKLLIFSEKGGTGESYHADLTYKNKRKRIHYLLQPGWKADKAVQGLGRTHRSNQAHAPHYILVTTDIQGQKRFISTIARRLDQLGALTKGQRETGSQGIFTSRDNLESPYARAALRMFFHDLYGGRIPGVTIATFEEQTGLKLRDEQGQLHQELPEIRQWMNRLLSMKVAEQDSIFNAFSERLDAVIQAHIQAGTLDLGLESLKATKIEKVKDQVAYRDPRTNAETRFIQLAVTQPNYKLDWEFVEKSEFLRNKKSGKLWAVEKAQGKTNPRSGYVGQQYIMRQPAGDTRYIYQDEFAEKNWETVDVNKAHTEWLEGLKKAPDTRTHAEYMLSGALLPIWDRLAGMGQPMIRRAVTDKKERLLGRLIPEGDVPDLLTRLGIGQDIPRLTPEELFKKLFEEGYRLEFANGWVMKPSRVSGDERIELVGPDYRDFDILKKYGVFSERIQYNTRYFVPTDKDLGVSALDKINTNSPVVKFDKGFIPVAGETFLSIDPIQNAQPRHGYVAGMPAQRSLFDFKAVQEEPEAPRYLPTSQRVLVSTTGNLQWSGTVVTGTADVASLLASIRKSPQELFWSVTADRDGNILEIHRYSKGTRQSAMVHATEVVGRILNIKGAARAYMVHNHPSGMTEPSAEDSELSRSISALLATGDIASRHIVIGQSAYQTIDEDGKPSGSSFKIPPAIRKISLPIKERSKIIRLSGPRPFVTSSSDAIMIHREVSQGDDGALLLDRKNRPLVFIPVMTGRSMKATTADILRASESVNASAAVIYTQKANPSRVAYLQSLAKGGLGDIHILDIVEDDQISWNDDGKLPSVLRAETYGVRPMITSETLLAIPEAPYRFSKKQMRNVQALANQFRSFMKIAGAPQEVLDRIELEVKPFIDLKGKRFEKSMNDWLRSGLVPKDILAATTIRKMDATVELAMNLKNLGQLEKTAYHEWYHVAKRWLMTKEHSDAIEAFFPGEEGRDGEADAFAQFAMTRRIEGLKGDTSALHRLWLKLRLYLERLGYWLDGQGFKTPEDIFGRIVAGAYEPHFGIPQGAETATQFDQAPLPPEYQKDIDLISGAMAKHEEAMRNHLPGDFTKASVSKIHNDLLQTLQDQAKDYLAKSKLSTDEQHSILTDFVEEIVMWVDDRTGVLEGALDEEKDQNEADREYRKDILDDAKSTYQDEKVNVKDEYEMNLSDAETAKEKAEAKALYETNLRDAKTTYDDTVKAADLELEEAIKANRHTARQEILNDMDYLFYKGLYDAWDSVVSEKHLADEEETDLMLAGVRAQGRPKALSNAVEMWSKGGKSEDIWAQTGWMKGPEGKWRFEIDDSQATLTDNVKKNPIVSGGLTFMLNHPRLFEAYPELKDIMVSIASFESIHYGKFTRSADVEGKKRPVIVVNARNPEEAKEILFHEIQHAIQTLEGFAQGYSSDVEIVKATYPKEFKHWVAQYRESMKKEGRPSWSYVSVTDPNDIEKVAAYEIYRRHAGEIEARDTVSRLTFSSEDRRFLMPYTGEYIPRDQWIVLQGKGTSFSVEDPSQAETFMTVQDPAQNSKAKAHAWIQEAMKFPDRAKAIKISQSFLRDKRFAKSARNDAEAVVKRWRKAVEAGKKGFIVERPDITYLEKLIMSPEFLFEKVEAAQRVFTASLDKVDDAHNHYNNFTDQDRFMGSLKVLAKERPEEFKKLEALIWQADRNQEKYNPDQLRKKGFSDQAIKAWSSFRSMMDRALDALQADMMKLIAEYDRIGLKLPEIVTYEGDKRLRVNLRVAMSIMGKMRGWYAPRVREAGRFQVIARKKGANPMMEFFDLHPLANRRAKQLEAQGYIVNRTEKGTIPKTKKMPEDVFQLAGSTIAMNAMINSALERGLSRDREYKLDDFGLRGFLRKFGPGNQEFVVAGPTNTAMNEVMKKLGGRYWPDREHGGQKAWHFSMAPEDMEYRITRALAISAGVPMTAESHLLFAHALATEVANIVKGRGFRSAMIKRADVKGEDVWVGYDTNLLAATSRYLVNISSGMAKKTMMGKMVQAVTGTDVKPQDFSSYEKYLDEVKKRRIDPETQPQIHDAVTKYIQEMGRNEEFSDRVIGFVKAIAVLKYLGLRLGSAAINLTSLVTSVPGAMHGYGNIPLQQAPILIGRALNLYRQYRWGNADDLKPDIREVFDTIRQKGWDEAQYTNESLQVLQGKYGSAWDKLSRYGMIFFGTTEHINRVSTIAGSYLGIKAQNPDMPIGDVLELAKKISDRAHGVYGKTTRPYLAQGSNPFAQVARMFYVFSKFSHNYLQTMYDLGFTKRDRVGLTYMMLAPAILSGFGAMPLIGRTFMYVMGQLLGALGDDRPEEGEERFYRWLEENLASFVSTFARFGIAGLAGVNIKGSIEIKGFEGIPMTVPAMVGAPGSVVLDLYEGGRDIVKGEVYRGTERMMPGAIRGGMQAAREYREGITTRKHVPEFYRGEKMQPSVTDTILKAITFQPAGMAKLKEQKWSDTELKTKYSEQRGDIYSRLRGYYSAPEESRSEAEYVSLMEDIREYNETVSKRGLHEIGVAFITKESIKSALKRKQ